MSKKIGIVFTIWLCAIGAYIILSVAYPAITGLISSAASTMSSSSNMSNYPGMLSAVEAAPVYLWFIPGGVAFIATAVLLRDEISALRR